MKKESITSAASIELTADPSSQPIEYWLNSLRDGRAETAIDVLASKGADAVAPVMEVLLNPMTRDGYENAGEVLCRIGEPAVAPLIELLANGSGTAAWLLGQMRVARAAPLLIPLLKSKDQIVRWTAVEALIAIGDRESVPALVPKLRDRASLVRSAAVKAMGKMGDTSAIDDLMRLSNDRYPGIRDAAQQAVDATRTRAARNPKHSRGATGEANNRITP